MPAKHRNTLRSRVDALLDQSRTTTPTVALFTASACLNITTGLGGWPAHYSGYQPWHRLVRPADPDLPALPLTFTVAAANPQAAAQTAAAVGRRDDVDLNSAFWPLNLRRLSTGDAVIITPHTPTTGERTYWALAPGGGLTELPCINEPLLIQPNLQLTSGPRAHQQP